MTVVGVGVLLVALLGFRGGDHEANVRARALAGSACDLTSGAQEAGRVDTDSRLAAAMLLLDRAIIESARAAETDPSFAELDQAVQRVHTAAHRRDPQQYQAAMESALATCRSVAG